jgi:hypothetical protein
MCQLVILVSLVVKLDGSSVPIALRRTSGKVYLLVREEAGVVV